MSDLTDNLEKLIQKAALDGALTEGAVDQFHSLVKERDALKDDNDTLNVRNKDLDERVTKLDARASAAEKCAEEWAGREQDLMDREGKCTELEIRKECAETRVEDHKSMVGLIFRNAVMKKGVMTPLPGLKADQYGTSHAPFAQKDDVEEEET
jgi:predicted nuclease with TOPRIM domain